MKKIIATVILIPTLLCSCKNTWTQEDRDSFYQACTDDAATWSGSAEGSRIYCDCVLGKIMEKYPHVSDALEHIDQLAKDPQMQECIPPDTKKTQHLPAQY